MATTKPRYCVYDDQLLKFVGPVHDTRAKAETYAEARELPAFTIRTV